MDGSDGDLVRAVKLGRREAYDELVRRHAAKISAVCRSRLGARGPVEDMVQESFLRGFRSLPSLAEPEKFGSWLYGIAMRACLDWLKAKKRHPRSYDAAGLPDGAGKSDPPEDSDRNAKLHEQIDALPESYREVVLLFYYRKQSYQEMSELLNLSPAAINARLTKARAMLRERMAGAL
jgi:RNA polymerase sigma-70 factor (ECF subfamily)